MLRMRTRRSAGLSIFTLSMLLTLVAAPVAARNPPGNNGTVKIDALEWDAHPDNEPHVGCTFEVDFYGFDEGDLWAEVIFEAHAPTGRGVLLADPAIFIGEDDNAGGGSVAGWDASRQYDLTAALGSYDAHPEQGYHVRLTVHADGSQGADTKHKVFWVEGCDSITPLTPPNAPGHPSLNPPRGGTGAGSHSPREGTAGGGLDPGALLPDTALDPGIGSLALLAGALLLGGSAGLAVAEVRRTRTRR